MTQVLVDEARSSEAAVRVLTGISVLAHAKNDSMGLLRLQVELRRELEATTDPSGCVLRWRLGQAAWASLDWDAGDACVSRCELPLESDRSKLGWLTGELELELTHQGRRLTFHEPFSWDGRAVKDWLVLGPQAEDDAPEPPSSLGQFSAAGHWPGLQGRTQAWTAHQFNPSRVARDVRHFYNLEDVFQCKDGVCSAMSLVRAEKDGDAEVEFYHDGKARLWLNGVELDLSRGHRQPVALKSGNNLFWVRLSNVTHQGRGLYLAMHSTEGGARGLSFCLPDGVALPE